MARGEETRSLTGPQKAAVLMMALGEAHCAQLFGMMHEDEIREISSAMAQLGPVRSDVVERLCVDFAEHIGGATLSMRSLTIRAGGRVRAMRAREAENVIG